MNILVIAAHPDDEVLGCGATCARLAKEGNDIHVLILGEGITSRDARRDAVSRAKDIKALKDQTRKAGRCIGSKDIIMKDFPDNRFDGVELLDIVKTIEEMAEKVSPDMVFTHYREDLNVDHRITFQAVITAFRPKPGSPVKEIYSFEIPSSTEWNFPCRFSPNVFFDVSGTMSKKMNAAKVYSGEIKGTTGPRSLEGIETLAGYRGFTAGVKYAEAFECVRVIK